MHLFISFFVPGFVRPELANESLIPFIVQKWTFCLIGFPSSINDDFKRGCVTDDHSFKHGCFPILIQYLTTALKRIPLTQWLWCWLINQAALVRIRPGSYMSAMHLFISFFVTDFVRKTLACYT